MRGLKKLRCALYGFRTAHALAIAIDPHIAVSVQFDVFLGARGQNDMRDGLVLELLIEILDEFL